MMKLLTKKHGLSTLLILSLCLSPCSRGAAQTRPVEGLHENTPNVLALTHATISISPLITVSDATLVIRDGHIEAVGRDVSIPADAVITDLGGKHLYAGFIDLYTHYGIPEVKPGEGKKETQKGAGHWNDAVHPEIDAAALFSPDAKSAGQFRASGITCALILPRDGIERGAGAVALLADGDRNSSLIKSNFIQSMAFERNRRSAGYPNSLMGSIALIRQTLLDAAWYGEAWKSYHASPAGQTPPETNLALAALSDAVVNGKPLVIETTNVMDILHSARLAREFNLKLWVRGSGDEYRRLDRIKDTNLKIILPVNFPPAPDVSTKSRELEVSLRDLRHWEIAPGNPSRLHRAGIPFALTTSTLPDLKNFIPNVRKAVGQGLPENEALAALTTIPAGWLEMSDILGTLEKGKIANIIVSDGNIFEEKSKIADVYVAGKKYTITEQPDAEIRGAWDIRYTMNSESGSATAVIEGEPEALKGTITHEGIKVKISSVTLIGRRLTLLFSADSFGFAGICRMEGTIGEKRIAGTGSWVDGSEFSWQAELQPRASEAKENKKEQPGPEETAIVYPEGAFGRSAPPEQPEFVLVRNGTLWTSGAEGIIAGGDMLVERGKIVLVGRNLKAPEGALVIDASGKHVTPGIIDAHSHLAIDRGVNEATDANTAETRIEDVIQPDDVNIYRQLAGGVTMAELIHGSANPIGGQTATVKLRWGSLPDEMLFENAMPGIKFALGENVKQSNWGMELSRYPKTRMGVEQYMRDSFQAAKDYRAGWQEYERKKYASPHLVPPRRILRNEALLEVLDGKRQVHCHSYRQDEILATLRLAEDIGFRIDVLIHILEGYKVAEAIKAHGAMPTTFSDWWAYKFEVIDAIPYNGPLMLEEGLVVGFNSDDYEMARHLNTEAAKAVKYGGVPPEEALKFVTINPAKQLRIDRYTGSLETGKDADFVIWSGDPLSPFSICEATWIDGRNYFSLSEDKELRVKAEREKTRLVQKILQDISKNTGK